MTRPLIFLLACLMTGTALGQSVLVNTRLYPSEIIDEEELLQLDLQEFFQLYSAPGPVATFTITMPVPDEERKLTRDEDDNIVIQDITGEDDGDPRFMTYKRQSGESYSDPYEPLPTDFVWETYDVEYNLLADDAPGTVANFITYANDGAYTNTIVHRNESTGQYFGPGGGVFSFQPLPIIQAGGWALHGDPLSPIDPWDDNDDNDFLFTFVETRPAIAFEETRSNTTGTLSMARGNTLNSATSQFFINLDDNTNRFSDRDGNNLYAVFGELANPDEDQPILDQFANSPVFDLSSAYDSGSPNLFPSMPFSTIPMYTPEYWWYKANYARFSSVSISEGDPAGITYSWEYVDEDPENEEVSEEDQANRDAFAVSIEGSQLVVEPVDTGVTTIQVSGSSGGQTRTFEIVLVAYNEDALRGKFGNSNILQGGKLETQWYGILNAMDYPWIIHDDHGKQLVYDDYGTPSVLLAFDYGLDSLIYTSINIYPYIYAYAQDQWLWYVEESGPDDNLPRWFYLFDGDNSRWVEESEL